MARTYYIRHFIRDLLIVAASILMAFVLVKTGYINSFINSTDYKMISSFVAGIFFTSIFTVAPAGVALAALATTWPPVLVAFFGALGAACMDLVIIRFVRKDLVRDFDGLAKTTFKKHIIKAFHFGFLKWVAFIAGMFLIATPLPDEAGLFLIGISKINVRLLPLVLFVAHFLGILALITIVTAI